MGQCQVESEAVKTKERKKKKELKTKKSGEDERRTV